ncbi:hypothetical protein AB0L80_11925 [Streptomyces sp. NPDC052069]|uniref:hypothetical protein n=1 Tax=Streptomyces sp. NPDC052069 TaxID=3154650 RepID=UPI00341675CC
MTALTDVLLAIAVVGVANMWAQSGMRSVHTAWFAGMLCCYDLVATGLTTVMDRFAAQVVGLPFAPLPAVTQDGPPVALGLGDLLLLCSSCSSRWWCSRPSDGPPHCSRPGSDWRSRRASVCCSAWAC